MENATVYPTLPMLEMMNKRAALEDAPVKDTEAIKAFQKEYLIETGLKSAEAMERILTLFRLHAHTMKGKTLNFTSKMSELTPLMDFLPGETMDIIGGFYFLLADLYTAGRYVFYGLLTNGSAIPFDLREDETNFRLITTAECNTCKKKPADLMQCTSCKKAAYCNRECQKADFKFHKRFCAQFCKQAK